MAASFYCLGRHKEAEHHWVRAVQRRPSYLEAVEHLVGLLYKKRSEEAIDIICHVQKALAASSHPVQATLSPPSDTAAGHTFSPQMTDGQSSQHTFDLSPESYGSSGYGLPGSENGRILALIHAKGTMLYGLKDVDGAAQAFEEAVLISVGRNVKGIRELVRGIQECLSQVATPAATSQPLLLTPDKARHTARLLFGGAGDLPGLRWVTDFTPRRAAVQTTSNSLLSLAKIFQDSMASGSSSSSLARLSSSVGDVLALYYLSLSLQESPSTANNVGILLAGIPQTTSNFDCNSSPQIKMSIPGILPGSGLSLALAYYNYGLRLDPKHVHLHTNLGSLLKDVGQLDLAIQMYERAVACDGTFDIALTNLANAVKDKGRISEAIGYYRRAVAANPGFAEAVCGLFTALSSVCDWKGRGGVYLYLGKYDRWHVDESGQLVDAETIKTASGLSKSVTDIVRQQLDDASHWGRDIVDRSLIRLLTQNLSHLSPNSPSDLEKNLQKWAGSRWAGSRLVRLLERAAKILLRKWYLDQQKLHSETKLLYSRPRLPPALSVPSAPTVLPFHTFTSPLTAKEVRVISQRNAIRISCATLRAPWLPETILPPPAPPRSCLNVGYVSSDFNNHPLAMQSVFGFHDTERVRAICYATTPSDKSSYRMQIEKEAPVFRDASSWTPERLINQISNDGIHILVNLNGYTRGARNEIFAARPAPVQMSFMGFAGTLGAEWCDYILADTTAIPPSTLRPWRQNQTLEDVFHDDSEADSGEWIYTENIIFCRDTFFCCDHAQSSPVTERNLTWAEEQDRRWSMRRQLFPELSEDTVILANFNQLYKVTVLNRQAKIDPSTFRSWLRILAQVPRAILWLLRFPEAGEANLRRTAEQWAGPEVASRLIFTDVAQKSQHISRARICDLFLDTPECNAHTTAADVLWSSTPLLTYPRYPYKMCSRMAASILRGALPKTLEGQNVADELIATSEKMYEKTAIDLAVGLSYSHTPSGEVLGSGRLAEMRKLLWHSRWTCGLFDTRRWVRDVETAYEQAWKRWEKGEGGDIYL
ncbi:UDP-N-acetylglucosaminyltransferase [Cordyceps javanica]|nr:UDP-N-acetylglucosaminyltransferase [Cordyceps javanica]